MTDGVSDMLPPNQHLDILSVFSDGVWANSRWGKTLGPPSLAHLTERGHSVMWEVPSLYLEWGEVHPYHLRWKASVGTQQAWQMPQLLHSVHSLHLTMCALLSHFSRVWLFTTLWAVACQAPLSTGFSSKNTGVGCRALLQGVFLTPGSNPYLLRLLPWQVVLYY